MANTVVSLYSKAFNTSKDVLGNVIGLHYLEETTNEGAGSRFLLEMDIKLQQDQKEMVHTSEYVYMKKNSTQLCQTSNFKWTMNVEIHFVVAGEY